MQKIYYPNEIDSGARQLLFTLSGASKAMLSITHTDASAGASNEFLEAEGKPLETHEKSERASDRELNTDISDGVAAEALVAVVEQANTPPKVKGVWYTCDDVERRCTTVSSTRTG